MNVADLVKALHSETQRRAYVERLVVLDHSSSLLKARLYISVDLFIQVYRNDRFDTTNLVLMHNGQRICDCPTAHVVPRLANRTPFRI